MESWQKPVELSWGEGRKAAIVRRQRHPCQAIPSVPSPSPPRVPSSASATDSESQAGPREPHSPVGNVQQAGRKRIDGVLAESVNAYKAAARAVSIASAPAQASVVTREAEPCSSDPRVPQG